MYPMLPLKKFIGITLGLTLAVSTIHMPSAAAFNDVSSTDWFYGYTQQLTTAGVIANNPSFNPYRSISRAELAKMAVNAAIYQKILTLSNTSQQSFCDVDSNHWATHFIQTLFTRGAVQGTPTPGCQQGRLFFPNNAVSRAEALKILLGVYGISPEGSALTFNDVDSSSWYAGYVAKAAAMGVINGNGNFRPSANLSRAEMSKIIINLMTYVSSHPESVHTSTTSPTDNGTTHNTANNQSDPVPTTTSNTPTNSATASPSPTPSTPPTTSAGHLPSGALTFYALGDSLTEGDQDETGMGGYPPRLQNKIEEVRPGSRVISIGVSGNDSGNLVDNQLNTAVSARPDGALVLIGSNNMWQDCWNEGNDTSAGTISNYSNNMETIMSRLHNAGIKIFVGLVDNQSRRTGAAGVCPSAEGRARMSRIATAFNDVIRTKATTYDATVVDFYNINIFYSASTLSDDGNHPNAAGYEAMARLWFNAINAQL